MTDDAAKKVHAVPVPGGDLEVHEWGSGPDAVVALHGITANAMSFAPLARALGDGFRVLAPDLRGRAGSRAVAGDAGLVAHADDAARIARAFDLDRPVLLGHSMGAFIADLATARHPDVFRARVLVDGGPSFPPALGADADLDEQLRATIGPAMARLSMSWADRAAHLDFWSAHPALGPLAGDPDVVSYLEHDLLATADGFVSSCVADQIRLDGAAVLADAATAAAFRDNGVPAILLRAERGMTDQPPALLPLAVLADLPDSIEVRTVAGTNHYTILLSAGVADVAAAVREAVHR
jgi:pimeloyl-ACP methyl ester carboxylesterase